MPHDHLPAAMRPGEAEPTAAIGLSKAEIRRRRARPRARNPSP